MPNYIAKIKDPPITILYRFNLGKYTMYDDRDSKTHTMMKHNYINKISTEHFNIIFGSMFL